MSIRRSAPRRADLWLLAGWIALLSVLRAGRFEETDPYWQARVGLENLAGTPLARPDTWSWDPVPGLFYPNSPAWNAALGLAWQALDFWGLFLAALLSIAAYLSVMAWLARLLGAPRIAVIAAMLLLVLLVLPMLSARATLVAQTLFMAGLGVAYVGGPRLARTSRWAGTIACAAAGFTLSLAGNWIHLSWTTFAAASCVTWALVWFLTPGMPRPRAALLTVAAAAGLAGGVALGPYGADVWAHSQAVVEACRGLILEWTTPLHGELLLRWLPPTLAVAALAIVSAGWIVRRARTTRGGMQADRLMAALVLAAAPFTIGSFVAIRFLGIAGLTLAPVLAWWLGRLPRPVRAWSSRRSSTGSPSARIRDWTSARFWRVILTATLLVLAPFAVFYAWPHSQPPTQALNGLLPPGCRLFTPSNEAASVVLTREDVPIWLDGRADYWGRQRLVDMNSYVYGPEPHEPVPAGTTCVLFPGPTVEPDYRDLVAALDESDDWTRVAEQNGYILWLPTAA